MKTIIFFLLFFYSAIIPAFSYPINFTDPQGKTISIREKPAKVVSVVPGITEIIFRIGAGDAVKGVTHHDIYPPETSQKEIVGGFFSPCLKKIENIKPDIIFVSNIHKKIMEKFGNTKIQVITTEAGSLSDIYKNTRLLGSIFDKKEQAAEIIDKIKKHVQTIAKKTARIPESERKRVIRLMGSDKVMTPGDDSFQNEYIKLAGGIPPVLNKKGHIVPVTREEWVKFNPQVIYGCGGDRKTAENFLSLPGWKDVEAVKKNKIFYFPCDLTCRASSRAGYFVSCLSARIYEDEFFKSKDNQVIEDQIIEDQVIEDQIIKSVPLDLDLDYVKNIQIIHNYLYDFVHKTLVIEFSGPMAATSTLEGYRQGLRFVGNSYSPPQVWGFYHKIGFESSRQALYKSLQKTEQNASFLFTGADMDKLALDREKFKDMEVCALVTAGVKSNAVRMSKDTGNFYEPGTINIILLTNMKLSNRAMTRAIISATEGKTAALNDMDIRSAYSGLLNQATGTGTDNIIVVQGKGTPVENAGGHSKMGELIAKAVYKGVQEATYKQNGLVKKRDVFERLHERKISLLGLISEEKCQCNTEKSDLSAALEKILLEPRYAGFLETAFALSDHYEQGLVADLSFFKVLCDQVAEEIAGSEIENTQDFVSPENLPDVVKMAFNAILNGIYIEISR